MTALGLGTSLIYSSVISDKIYANSASVLFDGTNDYGEISDHNNFTPVAAGGYAWSVWVLLPDSSELSQQRFISKNPTSGSTGYEWMLTADAAKKPRFFLYFGGTSSSSDDGGRIRFVIDTIMNVNTWYHLAFSWDGGVGTSAMTGWINGTQCTHGSGATVAQVGDGTTSVVNGSESVYVGRAVNNYGKVHVDEFALFNTELSNTQVGNIYNSGEPTDLSSHDGLVGYWRMGEDDTGTTITDLSSTGEDMTLENGAAIDTAIYKADGTDVIYSP